MFLARLLIGPRRGPGAPYWLLRTGGVAFRPPRLAPAKTPPPYSVAIGRFISTPAFDWQESIVPPLFTGPRLDWLRWVIPPAFEVLRRYWLLHVTPPTPSLLSAASSRASLLIGQMLPWQSLLFRDLLSPPPPFQPVWLQPGRGHVPSAKLDLSCGKWGYRPLSAPLLP